MTKKQSIAYRRTTARTVASLRRSIAERSLLAFGYMYLPKYFQLAPSRMHLELGAALERATQQRGARLAIAAPRGHAKSTLVSLAYVLWSICYRRERYVILISNIGDQADDQLSAIKEELQQNESLIADFPEACEEPGIKPAAPRWRKNEIITRNKIKVTALGINEKIRGRKHKSHRPSLIVLDDIENEASVRSEEQRGQLKEYYTKTVAKAGYKKTNIIVIGTLLHFDSLLASLLDPDQSPGWFTRRYQAICSWSSRPELWEQFESILTGRDEYEQQSGASAAKAFFEQHETKMLCGTDVLWPERESYRDLITMRALEGQRSFDSEKQNIPIDPDDCLFSDAKLRFWDDEYDSVEQLLAAKGKRGILLGACDPSMGKKSKGSDPSAIIVLLRDIKSGQLYVLEADIAIRTPEETIETILEYCRKYRFYRFAIETIQFQEFMAHELKRRARDQGVALRVKELKPTTDKLGRIQSLEPIVSAGNLLFCSKHRILLDQLRQFPLAKHDDGPDALEMAVQLGRERRPYLSVEAADPIWDKLTAPFVFPDPPEDPPPVQWAVRPTTR